MKAGSLEKPEQFEVVDAQTFRIKFLRKSKLTLPDPPWRCLHPEREGRQGEGYGEGSVGD